MKPVSQETRFDEAPYIGAMTALVEKFLAGGASRELYWLEERKTPATS